MKTLVEQAPDAIFIADIDGRFTDVNHAGCAMLGYSRDEIIGKTVFDMIPPEDAPRLVLHRGRLLKGDVEVGEWTGRRKDGTCFPTEISAKILPDGRWEAFVRDITKRKGIEHQLRLSEAKFSGIVSVSADAMILIDENQNIVMFNEGARKLFGYAEAEIVHSPLEILVPERFRLQHRRYVEHFASGPVTSRLMDSGGNIFGLRKNGEEFPADVTISKVTVEGETILAVRIHDITQQKRVENDQRFLSEAGAALSATLDYEETLESIASLIVNGIADVCVLDASATDGNFYRQKVVSREPSKDHCESLARAPFTYVTPSILRVKKSLLERDLTPERLTSFAEGEAAAEAWRAFDPRSMITLPLAAQGKVLAVIVLLSHRKLQAEDLRLAEEFAHRAATALQNALLYRDLKQAIKGREQVLAVVSHDLRNPLIAISMMAKQLRLADLTKRETLKEYASAIDTCTDQMMRLIRGLLEFSKIQNGKFSIRKASENATRVIASAVESVRKQVEARHQALTMDIPATLPEIRCDKHRIRQALANLLENAVAFTPEAGAITVKARKKNNDIVISVSDTGPGILPEHLPKIFDEYWQAEETKNTGAGLGLAIAKGIAEAHGGRIWAESQMGVGSTFHLAVPLARMVKKVQG